MNCVRYFNNYSESNRNVIPVILPSSNKKICIQINIDATDLSHSNMVNNISSNITTSEQKHLIDLFGYNELSKAIYYMMGDD